MAMMMFNPLGPLPTSTDTGPLAPLLPPGTGLGEFGRELQRQTTTSPDPLGLPLDPSALPTDPTGRGMPAGGHRRLAALPTFAQTMGGDPLAQPGQSEFVDDSNDPISLAGGADAETDARRDPADDLVAITMAMTAWPQPLPTNASAIATSLPASSGPALANGATPTTPAALALPMAAPSLTTDPAAGPVADSAQTAIAAAAALAANEAASTAGAFALPGVSAAPTPAMPALRFFRSNDPVAPTPTDPRPTANTPALPVADPSPSFTPSQARTDNGHGSPSVASPPAALAAGVPQPGSEAKTAPMLDAAPARSEGSAQASSPQPPMPVQLAPIELRSTALPAPVEAQVRATVASPEFAPALGAQISLLARDGIQEAKIQLHPAEMGPISVQIALDGSAARVDFHASVAATRAAIEASLPALAVALQDAGFTLAGGGVFQQSAQQQQPQSQGSAQNSTPDGNGRTTTGSLSDTGTDAAPARILRTQRGLVDLIA
ncbi:MAG: flagellar hook-length control protein FliK [Burkholderiales bacterium]|nr:flagellar hook-length control protein FliK [Burkholderiales bacterium]